MKHLTFVAFILLLIASTFGISNVLAIDLEYIGPPALVILNSTDESAIQNMRDYIESHGGRATHIYPPHILIGHIPEELGASLAGWGEVDEVTYTWLDPLTVKRYGWVAAGAVFAWNNNFMGMAEAEGLEDGGPNPEPLINDAFIPPPAEEGVSIQAPPFGGTSGDQSEFMIGSVAVTLILTESNGVIDPSTEDWTASEQSNVISEVQAGLNWWVGRAASVGANLSFQYYTYLLPTRYEPINRPGGGAGDQDLWINDAMSALGYTSGGYFGRVSARNSDIRNAANTDWAYTIFVADSSNDGDNKFTNGKFAYAYYGGPFSQMTYGNNGWGIGNMDKVTAHEAGHIFYALDEYADSGCNPGARNGYLNVINSNCENGGLGNDCIMNHNSWTACQFSMGQLGLRDQDGDSIPDILDTYPNTSLPPYSPDPTNDTTPTYTGTATVVPLTNQNPMGLGHDITLNTIANVQYRIDGGPWFNATASDGAFNEPVEDFTFTSLPLARGSTYTFDVRAINSVGNVESTYASDTLTINSYPTADANGPYISDEGSPVNLDGSGSSDPEGPIALYEWDLNGDGTFDVSTASSIYTHTWPDDYSGTLFLRVTDNGGLTDTDSTTVTINNVAPTVYFASIVPADEGSMFTGSGWFEDPGDDTWTATVDYGDGSGAQSLALNPGKTFDLAHTYCDNDDYTITVTVEDDDGGVGVGNAIAPINNVIPVVDAGADQTIMAGDWTTFTGTYSDAGWCDTHTAMWDFGDAGATAAGVVTANPVLPPAPVTGTVAVIDPPGGHSYFSAGDHTVTLTVTDDDLGAGSDTLTVEVEYIPATIFFDMDTINKKGGEKWFTVYIELPVRGDVKEINLASLLLNGVVPAETDPKYGFVKSEDSYIMDTDKDEELERMVKFPRKDVAATLAVGDEVEIAVTGCVQYTNDHGDTGCADFKGTETIRVIEKGKPVAAPALAASSTFGAPECYPNPANPEVWIPYKLGRSVDVNITIYDANGQLIRTLKLGHQEAGAYISKNKAAYWDGRNEAGEQVASGLYFYTIQAGDYTATKKMVIAK